MNKSQLETMGVDENFDFNKKQLGKIVKKSMKDNTKIIEKAIENFINNSPAFKERMRKYIISFNQTPASNVKDMAAQIYNNRKTLHDQFKRAARKNHMNKESFENYLLSPMATYDFDQFERGVEETLGFEGFDDLNSTFDGFEGFEGADFNQEGFENFGLQDVGIALKAAKGIAKGIGGAAKGLASKLGHKTAEADSAEKTKALKGEIEEGEDKIASAKSAAKKSGVSDEGLQNVLGSHSDDIKNHIKAITTAQSDQQKDLYAKTAQKMQQDKLDTINALTATMDAKDAAKSQTDMQKMMPIIIIGAIVLLFAAFYMGKKS